MMKRIENYIISYQEHLNTNPDILKYVTLECLHEKGENKQNEIERFCQNKHIRLLTKAEIQARNEFFDKHYRVDMRLMEDSFSPSYEDPAYEEARVTVEVYGSYNRDKRSYDYYHLNAIDLKKHVIEGLVNNIDVQPNSHKPMRMSDIKYQTLRKALEWVKSSGDPRFDNYKNMSIDDFHLHALNGSYVKHIETKRTSRETIQIYTKQQFSLGKNMTEQEKKGFFLSSR